MRRRTWGLFLAAAGVLSCGRGGGFTGGFTPDAAGPVDSSSPKVSSSDASEGGPISTFGDATVSGDGAPPSNCAEGTDVVYVVSSDNTLHSFDPPSMTFTLVGTLACPDPTSPFAMSVARDGTAWVLYEDGAIFKVSTKDASCTTTSFAPDQDGFSQFGMGFSADSNGSQSEALFVCWTQGLARIDTTSLVLTAVGPMTGLDVSSGCDLTGTGAGALYSFIPDPTEWVIAQLDKTTSSPMWSHPLTPPIPAGGSWGTSFWGGDLYLYTTPGGADSAVWKYDPVTNVTTEYIDDVGFAIVGAGESTCVPTVATQ